MSSTAIPASVTSSVTTQVGPNPIVGLAGETVSFFGADGTTQQTLPADATDLTSAEDLVNAIKAVLIAHGLCK